MEAKKKQKRSKDELTKSIPYLAKRTEGLRFIKKENSGG